MVTPINRPRLRTDHTSLKVLFRSSIVFYGLFLFVILVFVAVFNFRSTVPAQELSNNPNFSNSPTSSKGASFLQNQLTHDSLTVDPLIQQQILVGSDSTADDYFGFASDLSDDGSFAVVGAQHKTIGSNQIQGAAYVLSVQVVVG